MSTLPIAESIPDRHTSQAIQPAKTQGNEAHPLDADRLESVTDGYLITDSYGVVLEANLPMTQMPNIPYPFLIGKPFAVFVPLPGRREFRRLLGEVKLKREGMVWNGLLVPRQRPIFSAEFRVVPITGTDHSAVLYWAIREVGQETALQETLQLERRRFQLLSRRLVEAQEMERRSLARDLHDEVGQLLTGLKMSLEYSSQQEYVAQAKLDDAIRIAMQLMEQIRTLSLQLRPPMLDTLGLVPTLRWYFEHYTTQTRIQVHFKCEQPDRRYDPKIELTVYRLIQEALTNVARYANVQEVWVQIALDGQTLHVSIEDFGAGFDYQRVQEHAFSGGLAGMRERVASVGGQLSIDSTPGTGTSVQADLLLGHVE